MINLPRKELFISVLIHTVVLMCLFYPYINKPTQVIIKNKIKIKPIESYLYSFPKSVQLNKTKSLPPVFPPVKTKLVSEKTVPIKTASSTKVNQQKIINVTASKKNSVKKINYDSELTLKNTITKQSLNAQIKNIHKYLPLDNKPINKSLQIKSIFNPNPALVPKSTTVSLEQREQNRKQQITNYGKDMSIHKDDEGNCSMRQDLTSVGMEGIIATQHFKCGGKTKSERNFSQHMKAAMASYK